MKKLLMIAALATLGATAMAVPPSLQPPVTTGGTGNVSSTEVRITANVVEGVAVNEASPIDFGNLARGLYTGTVNQNTPGKLHVKASGGSTIKLTLDKNTTDLTWFTANGTDQTSNPGTNATITDVTVYGIGTTNSPTTITLGPSGEETRILTASFEADPGSGRNLGSDQKLGAYLGTVVVKAEKTK